eukprot:2400350-Rhodomonas_salina.1
MLAFPTGCVSRAGFHDGGRPCPRDYWCPADASEKAFACPPGSGTTGNGSTAIADCVCPVGMLNIRGILAPCHTQCPAGFERYHPDWLLCLPCPAGHSCAWNTSVAERCPTGEEPSPGAASCACPPGTHGN